MIMMLMSPIVLIGSMVITSDEIDTDFDSVQEMKINDTVGIIKSIL